MKLRAIDPEPPGADVVETLRETLEKANAGEISSVAIAVVYRDGRTGSLSSAAPSLSLLIGAANLMLHQLCKIGVGEK